MNLKVVWNNLASKFTGDNDLINELLSEIETSYTSPPRYYHNFCHLEKMIRMALLHTNRLLDPDTIMFSIFYHDLVYDPQRNDNEQNSAVMAQKALLKMGVPGNQIMKCQNQILATKDHNTRDDNDTNYLIDLTSLFWVTVLKITGGIPGTSGKNIICLITCYIIKAEAK